MPIIRHFWGLRFSTRWLVIRAVSQSLRCYQYCQLVLEKSTLFLWKIVRFFSYWPTSTKSVPPLALPPPLIFLLLKAIGLSSIDPRSTIRQLYVESGLLSSMERLEFNVYRCLWPLAGPLLLQNSDNLRSLEFLYPAHRTSLHFWWLCNHSLLAIWSWFPNGRAPSVAYWFNRWEHGFNSQALPGFEFPPLFRWC